MDTKIRILFSLIVSLFLNTFSNAQNITNSNADQFHNKLYQIRFQQLSNNGKFVAFKKAYEKLSDTLVLIDAQKRNEVVLEEGGVGSFYFTGNNKLFYQRKKEIISYDLINKQVKSWPDIVQWQYVEDDKIFVLLEKTVDASKIIILDENGKVLQQFIHGQYFKVVDDLVAMVIATQGGYLLTEYRNRIQTPLYLSAKKINYVLNASSKGVVFGEEKLNKKNDICYFDKATKKVNRLSDYWKFDVEYVGATLVNQSAIILLKTAVVNPNYQKEFVDIWYGNAKDLRTKSYDKTKLLKDVVWNTKDNSVRELQHENSTANIALANTDYLLCFNEFAYEDYTGGNKPYPIYKFDLTTNKYHFVGDLENWMFTDKIGKYLLSKKADRWELYDLVHLKLTVLPPFSSDRAIFSADSKSIVFQEMGSLKIYDIENHQTKAIALEPGYLPEIMNLERLNLGGNTFLYKSFVDLQKPVILKLTNPENYSTGLAIIRGNKLKYIESKIPNRINSVNWNKEMSQLLYVVEDINLPAQLRLSENNKQGRILYDSNLLDTIGRQIKSKIYTYKNAEGKDLGGILIYPVNFREGEKYPMIVNIYENQSKLRNQFLLDGFAGSTDAFNIRYYLKRGYFVFLPDIVYGEKGTGWSALDAVERGVKAVKENSAIDFNNVALIGFSHGGYETSFIATQSKLFKTYLSGAGNSDLMRSYFSYNYNFNKPFYFQFENGQYRMNKPFKDDKELYIRNSPIYFAEQVNAPILLWAGMKDQNIYWEQTMEFYLGLKRNNKKVTALFYPDEAHGFQKPQSKLDIFMRVSDWMDYHLKGTKIDWIDRMYK